MTEQKYLYLARELSKIKNFNLQELERAFHFADIDSHVTDNSYENMCFCGYYRKDPGESISLGSSSYSRENLVAETYWIINKKYIICKSTTQYTCFWDALPEEYETTTTINKWLSDNNKDDKKYKISDKMLKNIKILTEILARGSGKSINLDDIKDLPFGKHFINIFNSIFDDIDENSESSDDIGDENKDDREIFSNEIKIITDW